MLNRKNYRFLLGGLLIIGSLTFSYILIAQATSLDDIVYPIAELGGCKNETGCRAFCDKPDNITSCVDFAEKHDLMSKEDAEVARKFSAIGKGPGGCTGKNSCEAYCDDINNMNECLSFAEQSGLMPPKELEEAKKVQTALTKGTKLPGGCRNKNSCEAFCENPDNMKECIIFAEAAGFIPPDELADAKKALIAIEKGIKPPRCRGKEDCDSYCSEPGNFEQCISFAEAAGFVSAEDAQMARKTGGKGPGNCRGREECEKFCEDEANGDACFNFAKEHNLISEEELRGAEEGKQKMQEALSNAPPEVAECLNSALGSGAIEKLKTGSSMPSRKTGDSMRQCFEKMMGDDFGPGTRGSDPGSMSPGTSRSGFVGPGGCKGEAECKAFCETNPEQCQGFDFPSGGERPRESDNGREHNQPPAGDFREGLPSDNYNEGGMPSPEQFREQYEKKYNDEFQRQFQQKYDDIRHQLNPPPDTNQPAGGSDQYQQQYQPVQPPLEVIPPPVLQPQSNRRSFLGSILNVLNDLLH